MARIICFYTGCRGTAPARAAGSRDSQFRDRHLREEAITVFGDGSMARERAGYRVVNLGSASPVTGLARWLRLERRPRGGPHSQPAGAPECPDVDPGLVEA